ncbi:MAG TPA: N-6 DNA methylase, partial [Stellaceae bacterium]|nr:N-6 DNA methylase [Stellaceae bacterium]
MQALIERILRQRMPAAPPVLPEYEKGGIGRPDLAFKRPEQPARAFIELKPPEASLDPRRLRGHDKDQFNRFSELPLWGFCNFHSIRLYRRDQLQSQAVLLPLAGLDPTTTDPVAERLIRRHEPGPFLEILETLAFAMPTPPKDAREIAESLARAARLVRQVVLDQCRAGAPPALLDVRSDFRETLFAHAAAGGYDVADEDALFANAFAQTLAFGLLLAREAGTISVNRDAYRALPQGAYPLLRATLRALTQDEILDLLAAAFDVLQDAVNAIDPVLLKPRGERDPILYFYEDFLGVFDPEAKKRLGVFFTPVPVVRFMVAATESALRRPLVTQGLLDPNVLLLDPACGSGTFLIAAMAAGKQAAHAQYGEGAVPQEAASLAQRLHGFELLVGPYTVAHYRMLREVTTTDARLSQRLPIFLADTLAAPAGAAGVTAHLGFLTGPIVDERQKADTLKRQTRILALLGNPPYRRLSEGEDRTVFAGWDRALWDDLKQAVQDAGWGGELNTFPELSVAFWRWCAWKLFESEGAPGCGVICLITNRTFLAGHPYAGLRQLLRRRFDTIDIIDLRGDSRGARPAGVVDDENVFDVQVGVCITIAVATGAARNAHAEARVRYSDMWKHGAFARRDKFVLLDEARADPARLTWLDVAGRDLDDF